ncbi:MAG: FHA domain-containing protein [Lachnospiraceae bacterium]|nr:FHA domain-containing protein [Lachnospiraceae bacterium]
MINMYWIVFMFFITISFLYFLTFSRYLYSQYKEAKIKYYKKKSNFKKYCIVKKTETIDNQIKNNATQIIDKELINQLGNYIIIEFIDKNGKILKTQTIYNNELTIGRADVNDIVLGGQTVSRKQCLIMYKEDGFVIGNLSKTNYTLLNGVPFEEEKRISSNDIIRIANYILRFREVNNAGYIG